MEEFIRNTDFAEALETCHVSEEVLDLSGTEKTLRDECKDLLCTSDSDSLGNNKINWDEIFNKKNKGKKKKRKVPKKMVPKKKSAKKIHPKEQKASTEQPLPDVERVYDAEFKVKAQRMQALPKRYDVAAQITLENGCCNCHAELKEDLIRVTLEEMPQVQIQDLIEKQISIIQPCAVPEPCQKHPYQIVLPNETALSMLPITEIHRELASFAVNNETHFIASENALKCLTQWNRHWLLPFSICATVKPDGNIANVLVLDSEFSVIKEAAPMRTYKAFRHLFEQALISSTEKERESETQPKPNAQNVDNNLSIETAEDGELASRFANLQISPNVVYVFGSPKAEFGSPEAGFVAPLAGIVTPNASFVPENTRFVSPISSYELPNTRFGSPEQSKSGNTEGNLLTSADPSEQESASCLTGATSTKNSGEGLKVPDIGLYSCTCIDNLNGTPPRRSFRKWQFRREGTIERHDIIVHCSHKGKDATGELVLEPIPEYQSDKDRSEQSSDAVRSAAMSLTLRKNASLLNVRVNGHTGHVGTFEKLTSKAFAKRNPDVKRQIINSIIAVLSQLQELKPGHYLLQHEASHGPSAMIMRPRSKRQRHTLQLNFDSDQLIEVDQAQEAKLPPATASSQASTADA